METKRTMEPGVGAGSSSVSTLPDQYGCGPVRLAGAHDALFERHLLFDNVVNREAIDSRQSFEAFAHSVRDVLSQRWVRTESTYAREDPKRIYYLSMGFPIGRSLVNNVTNLLLSDLVKQSVRDTALDWAGLVDQEPDACLGNWRTRASGGLLPGLDGDDATAGDGLRPAL